MSKDEENVNSQSSSLALLQQAISDPTINPENLKQYLAVKKEWEADEALKLFNSAIHKAQSEMPVIVKDGWNDHTKSKFAKLETVAKGIKSVYTDNGFAVSFSEEPCDREDWLVIIMTVRHVGNHVEQYRRYAPIDDTGTKGNATKTKIHGCQSTMSYMQRQLLCATFGVTVADEDNDGNTTDAPVEFITQEQADEIHVYIGNQEDPEQCKANMLKLCQCETIESMSLKWFDTVIKKLKKGVDQS